MNGYILESRTILESGIWKKPPLYFKVWHYLLLKAQYKDYKGLKRGQLITSIPEIRESCSYYVGYRKVTPSKAEIWNILEWLRNPYERYDEGDNENSMIKTTKTTKGLLVTICNFNIYQTPQLYEGNDEDCTKGTMKELRRQQQADTINKEREEREERKNKEYIYSAEIREIIDHLNQRTGSQYRASTKGTRTLIQARLKEGFTVDDFKTVIDKKCVEWVGTEWEKFLRPQTLFGTKFESYLNAKVVNKQTTGNKFLDYLHEMEV